MMCSAQRIAWCHLLLLLKYLQSHCDYILRYNAKLKYWRTGYRSATSDTTSPSLEIESYEGT